MDILVSAVDTDVLHQDTSSHSAEHAPMRFQFVYGLNRLLVSATWQ